VNTDAAFAQVTDEAPRPFQVAARLLGSEDWMINSNIRYPDARPEGLTDQAMGTFTRIYKSTKFTNSLTFEQAQKQLARRFDPSKHKLLSWSSVTDIGGFTRCLLGQAG
jgi:hypothetical protein